MPHAVAQSPTAPDWASILSDAKHVSDVPTAMLTPITSSTSEAERKNATTERQLIQQQFAAMEYIRANKIVAAIPTLIHYLNYAKSPGIFDLAHGPDLSNVKANWVAFGALVDMPESSDYLQKYCLDRKNPMEYRLAALHCLKYVDQRAFEACWASLKTTLSNVKALDYLAYIKGRRAQFVGIPDLQ